MQKEVREAFRVQFKWSVLEYAKGCRTVAEACSEFEISRSTFYGWKKAFGLLIFAPILRIFFISLIFLNKILLLF